MQCILTGRLCYISVRANRELVKDVLTCQPLVASTYKERHPDDTDDPEAVGVSSEDEVDGMEEVLGISRRLQKLAPSLAEPSTTKSGSAPPSDPATPAVPEEERIIWVKRKDLRRAQGILKGILVGKRVRMSTGASSQDVTFEVPIVQPGEKDCQLCRQNFKSTRSPYWGNRLVLQQLQQDSQLQSHAGPSSKILWAGEGALVQGVQQGVHYQTSTGCSP